MRIDTIWIAEFASAGWLESLGDYIDEEDRASFISVTEKNKCLSVQLIRHTLGCQYRSLIL